MGGTSDQFQGGCFVWRDPLVATGQPKGIAWCHCESCGKHTDAPVSVFVAFERAAFTVIKVYRLAARLGPQAPEPLPQAPPATQHNRPKAGRHYDLLDPLISSHLIDKGRDRF